MPTKTLAHHRLQLGRVFIVTLACETCHQRQRHHRSRNAKLDRFNCSPTAFAGIADDRGNAVECLITVEKFCREIEQPRLHHAAVPPIFGDCADIEIEFALGREQRKSFSVCLHHAVLDAVVNHFHVVSGTRRTAMQPLSRMRTQCIEHAFNSPDCCSFSSCHDAVAVLESMNAA